MARFQQRHFEAIAEVIQELTSDCERAELSFTVLEMTKDKLCKLFASDNPNFDLGRFQRACEPGANVKNKVN